MKLRIANGEREADQKAQDISAFTLLEVMIAIAIFFMAMFSILALVSQCLRGAHSLNETFDTKDSWRGTQRAVLLAVALAR